MCLSLTAVIAVNFFSATRVSAFPEGFVNTQIVGSGLSDASGFEFAPDGRIFILERTGAIKIYKNGQLLTQPFHTFSSVAESSQEIKSFGTGEDRIVVLKVRK